MKKLLLLVLFATCTLYAGAETLSKKSSRKDSPLYEPYTVDLYAEVGLNLATLWGINDFNYDKNRAQVGYYVGGGFRGKLFSSFYWGMELGLTTRGFGGKNEFPEADYAGVQDGDDVVFLRAYNVELLPVNIGYTYQLSEKVKLDAHVGMYLAYDYFGKYTYEDNFDDSYSKYYTLDEFAEENEWEYKRFDLGIKYGVGVWINDRVNFGVQVKNGFMPMFEYEDEDDGDPFGYTCNFMLTAGFKF